MPLVPPAADRAAIPLGRRVSREGDRSGAVYGRDRRASRNVSASDGCAYIISRSEVRTRTGYRRGAAGQIAASRYT